MPNLLRNVLAVLAGIAIGGGVNMALITLSPSLIPPPAGVDVNNAEGLSKSIHLFEPRHFVMPFLAHAIGTLAGTLAAYLIAATSPFKVLRTPVFSGVCEWIIKPKIGARPLRSNKTLWFRGVVTLKGMIAATYKAQIAYVVSAFFLFGGVAASFMIPAPAWFIAIDLLAAYLPMAWLGIQIGTRMKQPFQGRQIRA